MAAAVQVARKGDLVLVEDVSHDYVAGVGRSERVSYQFGVVASATRDGLVKSFRSIGWGDDLLSESAELLRGRRCVVASRSDLTSVEGVLVSAKAHHWPGHPGQPMPFDSVEDARDVVRPFRLAAAG